MILTRGRHKIILAFQDNFFNRNKDAISRL